MKSFKNYIAEVNLLNTSSKSSSKSLFDRDEKKLVTKTPKLDWHPRGKSYQHDGDTYHHVSTMKSGHKVFASHGGAVSQYHVHDSNKHGKIDLVMTAKSKKHKNGMRTNKVATLLSRDGGGVKAHDFYHHIMSHPKHKVILHTDTQTHGGAAVWKKLGSHKGINVHGYSKGKGENVTTGKHGEDDEDIYHHLNRGPNDPKPDHSKVATLVAHSKKWNK